MEKSKQTLWEKKTCQTSFYSRNNSKPLKRLQSSLPLDKSTKYNNNHHHSRLCKSDSSLLSTNSNSPPIHNAIADSTTSAYLDNSIGDHEQDSDTTISPNKYDTMNFPSTYHQHQQFPSNSLYSSYTSDPSSMIYNPAYTYMGSTSGQIPSTSSSMHFTPYGRYPPSVYQTNNYTTPFFWHRNFFCPIGFLIMSLIHKRIHLNSVKIPFTRLKLTIRFFVLNVLCSLSIDTLDLFILLGKWF